MSRCIVFTGGGTAGHVYPGISVIEKLRERGEDLKFIWVGSGRGMEKSLVEQAGIEFAGIPSGKLRRYFSLRNFTDIFKIAAGFLKACFLLFEIRPDLVFSKGGFVSVPPVAAAGLLKIPVLSHESDVSPGLATRINIRFSTAVLVSYEKTLNYLEGENAVLTGNPVRDAIFKADAARGRTLVNAGDRKVIMVIGGSQGALQINRLIESLLPELSEHYVIIHQTGSHDFDGDVPECYHRYRYIGDELPHMMAAADLIISRAGASTLWESAALGKPSILIPLGSGVSRGDQSMNAGIFRDAGASVVLEGEVTSAMLENEIERLMNDDTMRYEMGSAALRIVNGNPAEKIADYILERLS